MQATANVPLACHWSCRVCILPCQQSRAACRARIYSPGVPQTYRNIRYERHNSCTTLAKLDINRIQDSWLVSTLSYSVAYTRRREHVGLTRRWWYLLPHFQPLCWSNSSPFNSNMLLWYTSCLAMTLIAESRFLHKEKREGLKRDKKEETNGKLLQCANQNLLCPDQSMKQNDEQSKKKRPSQSLYVHTKTTMFVPLPPSNPFKWIPE